MPPTWMRTGLPISNVYEILNADKFIIDKAAVEKLQEVYA